jgi:hypothetical protein
LLLCDKHFHAARTRAIVVSSFITPGVTLHPRVPSSVVFAQRCPSCFLVPPSHHHPRPSRPCPSSTFNCSRSSHAPPPPPHHRCPPRQLLCTVAAADDWRHFLALNPLHKTSRHAQCPRPTPVSWLHLLRVASTPRVGSASAAAHEPAILRCSSSKTASPSHHVVTSTPTPVYPPPPRLFALPRPMSHFLSQRQAEDF